MSTGVRRPSGGLGRGLSALIPTSTPVEATSEIPLAAIRWNRFQPRLRVDEDELEGLAASIKEHGIIQPVLVTRVEGGYELIAGERRVRAAQMAGLHHVPAVVRDVAEHDRLALGLVENLQRSDLNALDEARAFRRLGEEFGLTQEEIAVRVGRARSSIANTLRLLETSPAIQSAVEGGEITEGHARAIATVADHTAQSELLAVVTARGLNVRQTEELARRLRDGTAAPPGEAPSRRAADPDLERLETGLRDALGTKVRVQPGRRGGRITIQYYDGDDLGRLYERLTGGTT
jgi:ParB family transcriptional regulator, chromosome partitioning protein